MTTLRPFWWYYGSKWKLATMYPEPMYGQIVEPFAGSAGYSLRYYDRAVTLVELNPQIAELWRWLTKVSPVDVRRIPLVNDVRALPGWVPEGARTLVGFKLAGLSSKPKNRSSAWMACKTRVQPLAGWTEQSRERVAAQVSSIRHWKVIEGDYSSASDIEATWFIDPPYAGAAGADYTNGSTSIDFNALGAWCQTRRGQTVVCEMHGATWLPFKPLRTVHPGMGKGRTKAQFTEVFWCS